jgi:hypothetical protein
MIRRTGVSRNGITGRSRGIPKQKQKPVINNEVYIMKLNKIL